MIPTTLQKQEPLLTENENRYVVSPILYQDIWDMFNLHRKTIWNEAEIDIHGDLPQWNALNDGERHFIKHVLAFFAASDGIVLENLGLRFLKDIQIPEARSFYSIQMYMETIHSIMYSNLLDTYITDPSEKRDLFQAIQNIPSVKQKADWAKKWIESTDDFATRLVAFACVEGIFFSGSFCCIYWLKERGVLGALCRSNDFIARDEGLHTDFACLLYRKYIRNHLPDEKLYSIVTEALEIEQYFITESLTCDLLGMNTEMMKEYIRFVANQLVKNLGHKELFPTSKQPFPFMDRICVDTKDSFFEGRVTGYQMLVEKNEEDEVDNLTFDDDF